MSHHLSGPNLRPPMDDGRLDMTDLFAFTTDGDRTVLIMNANPVAPTMGDAYHPDAVYRINVDTDGDHQADVAFSFVFSEHRDGRQTFTLYRADGEQARSHEAGGREIVTDEPVAFGSEPEIITSGPYRISVGLRSDPFFADLEGIGNDFQWTGNDWGIDKNILGIVLDMPSAELSPDPVIGVWGRISVRQDGQLKSVDRGAHPSVTAYFNQEDVKGAYNEGEPAQDWDTYLQPWSAVLAHTGHYEAKDAEQTLRTILPDVLRYDRSKPAAYPNGRTLTDDVETARIDMLSRGKVPNANIPPHTDLTPDFPYLGTPHPAPSA
ncbi:DUF4331 family protein [Streptomyces sp. TLI_105]|uniref:DUF4331 family protein n=1 Tax=Streptomyces sp. TLI_105 TaxID=1881019 RepID=UPI0008980D37|nr:DUF4331 family protein [Streptomyces sp. TLI_105]SEE23710.1 protein of unknown function [Streptomyces sp. TLI_105]